MPDLPPTSDELSPVSDAGLPFAGTRTAPDPAEFSSISPPPKRRLAPTLSFLNFAFFGTNAGVNVLLANQVTTIDPAHKVENLAIVSTTALILAMIVQPLIGTFSDRTRSRFGRRAPWMLIGGAIAAVSLVILGGASNVLVLTLFWAVAQVGINLVQGPMSAILPDRVPPMRRGVLSAFIGLGAVVGGAAGGLIGGLLAAKIGVAYGTFAVIYLVAVLLVLLLNRDFSSTSMSVTPFRWKQFFAGFWISPRRFPDFTFAFLARLLFTLAFYVVSTYQLFLLTDYVHMSRTQANQSVGLLAAATLPALLLGIFVSGYLSDKLGRRKPFLYFASAVMTVGILAPLVIPSYGGLLAMYAINGLSFGIYFAVDGALMTQVLPNGGASAARDMGILNIAANLPGAIAPTVAALLIGTVFGYASLFVVGGVLAFLSGLAFIGIKRVR